MTSADSGSARLSVAADVGGTFTDFIQVDAATGAIVSEKLLTTPDDPAEAVLEGTRRCLASVESGAFQQFVHGTTLVINALVERKGSRTGLITTQGLRDILEMRREHRHDVYNLAQEYPQPLVPRPLRQSVPERMLATGEVLQPLDEQAVRDCAADLRKQDVESVAVGFMHSYLNPSHEQRVRDILTEEWPEVAISLSSEVNPEQEEYERLSTTAANAYVKPRMRRYLLKLDRALAELNLRTPMGLFGSHGGLIPIATAAELPIYLVESGPAGGALAAAHVASLLGLKNVLAVDMGGTTVKMVGVRDGRVITRYDYEVARVDRFSPGSGLPVRVPVVDILEIGAGGGSIASVDQFGLLTVGPESAGADPGPACYGRGGALPTVTDADVVLGRLDPSDFLGGRMPLQRSLAEAAIQREIAARLNMSLEEAAAGIADVVDENMALTASEYIRERGIDPRSTAMVAYGGMGPVHAAAMAERMGVREVLVPPLAGVFSALGFMIAPRSLELTQSYHTLLRSCDYLHLMQTGRSLVERAKSLLQAAPGSRAEFTAGMRYRGQWHPIDVSLPDPSTEPWTQVLLTQRFLAVYERLYEQISEGIPVEMLTLRVRAVEPTSVLELPDSVNGHGDRAPRSLLGQPTNAQHDGQRQQRAGAIRRVQRDTLRLGSTESGPLIVVEDFTATLVPAGWTLNVEALGVLRLTRD